MSSKKTKRKSSKRSSGQRLAELMLLRQIIEDSPWQRFWHGYLRAWLLETPAHMAEFIGYRVADVHERMLAHVQENPERSLNLAPRGIGKSSLLTIGRALFEVCRNPEIRLAIISDTRAQAMTFLSEISTHLRGNEYLIWLFGEFYSMEHIQKRKKWSDALITIGQRQTVQKEGTLEAWGFDTAVVGRHFDVMLYDDVVSEKNARTENQRDRTKTKYGKKFRPCLMPGGQEAFVGTRYHFQDLYSVLMGMGVPTHVERAIIEVDGEERSVWPFMYSIEKLRSIRAQLGTLIFNSQYQNDTEAMKGSIFKYEWMRFCDPHQVPDGLRIFQGVDLAISQKTTADYFAEVSVGFETQTKVWYVLDSYHARLSFTSQKNVIKKKYDQFDPVRVRVESNQYQAVLSQELREGGLRRVQSVTTHKDKVTRAMKLSPLFEAGDVIIVRGQDALVNELLAFPEADHDDLFDALDIAITGGGAATVGIRVLQAAAS